MVLLVAGAFPEADNVQPVARPPLAVGGRGEQAVNHAIIGLLGLIGQIGLDLFRSWRESGKVDCYPPNERSAVGWRSGSKSGLVELCLDEGVDRIADCGLRIADCWD